ncbi:MAG: tRNA 4-thiouridine(8) synthase ThiI [Candidatus Bipolaricaulota bacterium]|nr:tRNA 4-thiouridine(8) synthase ThiI [Candidatus Bipolaricaulota bacterium]MDW8126424.1 tRNA 4-thiouridine(8) synthase ThiI [Candidatus Bipolaricaulota bacterium]
MTESKGKAVALMSGGLDSALAAAWTKRLGFPVVGLHVVTGLVDQRDLVRAQGAELGVPVRIWDAADEYLEVLKNPQFGRGQGMNPCLDCHIFLLRKAKEFMEQEGAAFVVTGEVLGQRPMTQNRQTLALIAQATGLGEKLVRPLSGRLLGPTFPERMGWVQREDWLDLQGRSRKQQLGLARELGISRFTPPSGCCVLVDPGFSARLRDLLREKGAEAITWEDLSILRLGRHFRLGPNLRLVVGRDAQENEKLMVFGRNRYVLMFSEVPGPVGLILGEPNEADLFLCAQIAARYSDAPKDAPVRVHIRRNGEEKELWVTPLSPADPRLVQWRIGVPKRL